MVAADDVECLRCRAVRRWGDLPVVEVLDAQQLRAVVTAWPAETGVEVRRCAACGASIARKARVEDYARKLG